MSDLVERLRENCCDCACRLEVEEEAADAIERLTAELAEARAERDHSRYETAQYGQELSLAEDAAAMLEQQILALTAERDRLAADLAELWGLPRHARQFIDDPDINAFLSRTEGK